MMRGDACKLNLQGLGPIAFVASLNLKQTSYSLLLLVLASLPAYC